MAVTVQAGPRGHGLGGGALGAAASAAAGAPLSPCRAGGGVVVGCLACGLPGNTNAVGLPRDLSSSFCESGFSAMRWGALHDSSIAFPGQLFV